MASENRSVRSESSVLLHNLLQTPSVYRSNRLLSAVLSPCSKVLDSSLRSYTICLRVSSFLGSRATKTVNWTTVFFSFCSPWKKQQRSIVFHSVRGNPTRRDRLASTTVGLGGGKRTVRVGPNAIRTVFCGSSSARANRGRIGIARVRGSAASNRGRGPVTASETPFPRPNIARLLRWRSYTQMWHHVLYYLNTSISVWGLKSTRNISFVRKIKLKLFWSRST